MDRLRQLTVFFRPTAARLLIFALLVTFFLTDSATFVPTQALRQCPLNTVPVQKTGYPFTYYTRHHLRPAEFSPKGLLFNLLTGYLLACLLVTLASVGISIVKKRHTKALWLSASLLLNLVLAVFIALNLLGENWLIQAIQAQRYRTAAVLLALGVPADSRNETGSTFALWEAVKKRNPALVRLLIGSGASANTENVHGMTALHLAAQLDQQQILRYLLQHGAEPGRRSKDGRTPLHFACGAEAVTLLLKHGADPGLKDRSGRTAADYLRNPEALAAIRAAPRRAASRQQNTERSGTEQKKRPPAPVDAGRTPGPLTLKTPTRKIDCTTSVGGSFVSRGRTYQVGTDKQGRVTVYQGASGFVFANCPENGYYHLILEGPEGVRKSYTNLINGADRQAPLVFANKQELVLQFQLPVGRGRLYWYFSNSKTDSLAEAVNHDRVSLIRIDTLLIKKPD